MLYEVGTVTGVLNTSVITGIGTQWANTLTGITPGNIIIVYSAGAVDMYAISSIASNTSIVVTRPLTKAFTASKYGIMIAETASVANFANQLASTLRYYQTFVDSAQQLWTGTGDVTLTKPDGTTIVLYSWSKIQADNLSRTLTTSQTVASTVTFTNPIYVGTAAVLKVGDHGVGGTTPIVYSDTTNIGQNMFFRIPANTAGAASTSAQGGIMGGYDGGARWQLGWEQGSSTVKLTTRIRNGTTAIWSAWKSVVFDNSMNNVIPVTMNSSGTAAAYMKLAELAPTSSGASGVLFMITNGINYGSIGLDYKLVYFSARGATTTALAARGLQIISNGGVSYNTSIITEFGVLYNSTISRWELWMKGPAYSLPSVQLIGNLSGPTNMMNGVTFDSTSTWQTTMPTGLVLSTEMKNWNGYNTTTDANGFIKTASPIVKLFGDGTSELNIDSLGVTTQRLAVGVYKVSGSLGFATEGWNVEIPQDMNGNRLCFVSTKVMPDGAIGVYVSKRKFDMETGNVVAGDPMDIPEDRWIDLRVEMPQPPEPKYDE